MACLLHERVKYPYMSGGGKCWSKEKEKKNGKYCEQFLGMRCAVCELFLSFF